MTDFFDRSLIVHEQLRGKIGIVSKMPVRNTDDLAAARALADSVVSDWNPNLGQRHARKTRVALP